MEAAWFFVGRGNEAVGVAGQLPQQSGENFAINLHAELLGLSPPQSELLVERRADLDPKLCSTRLTHRRGSGP